MPVSIGHRLHYTDTLEAGNQLGHHFRLLALAFTVYDPS
jgi:hypothetical protein